MKFFKAAFGIVAGALTAYLTFLALIVAAALWAGGFFDAKPSAASRSKDRPACNSKANNKPCTSATNTR